MIAMPAVRNETPLDSVDSKWMLKLGGGGGGRRCRLREGVVAGMRVT